MGSLGAILGLLTALATLAIEWLRMNPKSDDTDSEKALKRRKRHLEAKHKFSVAVGRGDSDAIKSELDALIDELHQLKSRELPKK